MINVINEFVVEVVILVWDWVVFEENIVFNNKIVELVEVKFVEVY